MLFELLYRSARTVHSIIISYLNCHDLLAFTKCELPVSEPCFKVNHEIGNMHDDITKVGPRLLMASLNHSSHSKCAGFADLQV